MKEGREKYWADRRALLALTKPAKQTLVGTIFEPDTGETKEVIEIRKFGRPAPKEARESVIERIYKKKDKLIDAQIDAATGLCYTTPDGTHVYTQKPNTATGEFLLNQLIGKPKETMDVKTEIRLNVDI